MRKIFLLSFVLLLISLTSCKLDGGWFSNPSPTPTDTFTPTSSITSTIDPTNTCTATSTFTPTYTLTFTPTFTPTFTLTSTLKPVIILPTVTQKPTSIKIPDCWGATCECGPISSTSCCPGWVKLIDGPCDISFCDLTEGPGQTCDCLCGYVWQSDCSLPYQGVFGSCVGSGT